MRRRSSTAEPAASVQAAELALRHEAQLHEQDSEMAELQAHLSAAQLEVCALSSARRSSASIRALGAAVTPCMVSPHFEASSGALAMVGNAGAGATASGPLHGGGAAPDEAASCVQQTPQGPAVAALQRELVECQDALARAQDEVASKQEALRVMRDLCEAADQQSKALLAELGGSSCGEAPRTPDIGASAASDAMLDTVQQLQGLLASARRRATAADARCAGLQSRLTDATLQLESALAAREEAAAECAQLREASAELQASLSRLEAAAARHEVEQWAADATAGQPAEVHPNAPAANAAAELAALRLRVRAQEEAAEDTAAEAEALRVQLAQQAGELRVLHDMHDAGCADGRHDSAAQRHAASLATAGTALVERDSTAPSEAIGEPEGLQTHLAQLRLEVQAALRDKQVRSRLLSLRCKFRVARCTRWLCFRAVSCTCCAFVTSKGDFEYYARACRSC